MSHYFDDLARASAGQLSRRGLLKAAGMAMLGSLFGSRFLPEPPPASAYGACGDPTYPHPCADICCRYDYYCASTELLNGSDTLGICCQNDPVHFQLCSDGTHGWCCPPDEACSTIPWGCDTVCPGGQEVCGEACCDTAAGEFCCNPDLGLCCSGDVECCFEGAAEVGTCCTEVERCVPEHVLYSGLPGRTCCHESRACRGQCCPWGELCVFDLECCPAARTNPADPNFCCSPGTVWIGPEAQCCLEGKACGFGECCPGSQTCIDGECQECPEGSEVCFDRCCPAGACCFGDCCGEGQLCAGECVLPETLEVEVTPQTGGAFTSGEEGVDFRVPGYAVTGPFTIHYSSQTAATHPLPAESQHLRSFQLVAETQESGAGLAGPYTLNVRYTPTVLNALGATSEAALRLLYWNGTEWESLLPCELCRIDRLQNEVTFRGDLWGEFALVLGPGEAPVLNNIYLPMVQS